MANLSRLPKAVIESYEWQYDGACTDVSVEEFFLPENARGQLKVQRESKAKAICATCPVVQRCLQHALDAKEPYGIWGGTSPEERAAISAGRTAAPQAA